MKKVLGLGLASLLMISCGGGASKGAASASAPTIAPSNVSLSAEMIGGTALDVTGPAFAKYDPGNKMLVVLLFDAATDPTPSCDLLDPSKAADLNKGAVVTFQIGNLPEAKAGSYPLGGVSFAKGDRAKGDMAVGGGSAPEGTKLEISQIDSSSMTGTVANPKGGKAIASIHATVCKAGSLTPPGSAEGPVATASAGSYIGPGESGMDIKIDDAHHQQTSGPSALAKLDPKTKTLVIYIWDFSYQPAPTCDHLAIEPEQVASGGAMAYAIVTKFPARAKGKVALSGAAYFNFMNGPADPITANGVADGSTVDIAQFDNDGFQAKITSAPTAKMQVSGIISATTCADGAIDFDSKKSPPAKASKKKKKK